MAWLTPDHEGGAIYTLRPLFIPAELLPYVNGAIEELIRVSNWAEHGDMTVDETIELAKELYYRYQDSISMMTGAIFPTVHGDPLPAWYLLCDGSVYDRADYPNLYDALPASYQLPGETFRVPDLRDRFVVGAHDGIGGNHPEGSTGGSSQASLNVGNLPPHTHESHTHLSILNIEEPVPGFPIPIAGAGTPSVTGVTGSGNPFDTEPPYYALRYVVFAI